MPCPKCKKMCTSQRSLELHMSRMHADISKRQSPCHMCSKCFSTPAKLKEHMISHTGERPHKCSVCGKGFGRAGNLKVHMRIHNSKSIPHSISLALSFQSVPLLLGSFQMKDHSPVQSVAKVLFSKCTWIATCLFTTKRNACLASTVRPNLHVLRIWSDTSTITSR